MGLLEKGSYAPVSVQWPLLYAENDFVGKGTLLMVSDVQCVVAGTMPVVKGMLLKLWISPTGRNDALCVSAARVVGGRENQFAVELLQLDAYDHEWLRRFVQKYGHSSVS